MEEHSESSVQEHGESSVPACAKEGFPFSTGYVVRVSGQILGGEKRARMRKESHCAAKDLIGGRIDTGPDPGQ